MENHFQGKNMEEFIKMMEEVFEKEKGSSTKTDNFRDYETWDSLRALAVMAMINQEYDVTIPREDFLNCQTIGDLFGAVIQRCSDGKK